MQKCKKSVGYVQHKSYSQPYSNEKRTNTNLKETNLHTKCKK